MLPDVGTGQGPGTLARKLSRCKEGMARVFAVRVQVLFCVCAIAVQTLVEPLLSQGAEMWFEEVGAVSRYKFDRSHF